MVCCRRNACSATAKKERRLRAELRSPTLRRLVHAQKFIMNLFRVEQLLLVAALVLLRLTGPATANGSKFHPFVCMHCLSFPSPWVEESQGVSYN